MSKILFIKLLASDEKEAKSDLRHIELYLSNLYSILERFPDSPAQKHPY